MSVLLGYPYLQMASLYQWRGVWGERQTGTLQTGKGYCANLGHIEDETGLVYMRARYYEPAIGRFISEDPARDGINWYLYADGNSVTGIDFSGKFTGLEVMAETLTGMLQQLRQAGVTQSIGNSARQQVLKSIAYYMGFVAGMLVALELESYGWPQSNVLKHLTSRTQIHFEVSPGHHGYSHVDLQNSRALGKFQQELKDSFGHGRLPLQEFLSGFIDGLKAGLS